MEDIILNEASEAPTNQCGRSATEVIAAAPSELQNIDIGVPAEVRKKGTVPQKSGRRNKMPRALTVLSLAFTIASLPFAFIGFVPLQLLFLALGLIFYIIDRKKNGKRGISLFGMICTLATFVIIFITLVYSFILLGIGIYTVYVNPEPYNFIMGTLKGFLGWFLGIFGINFNF